MLVRKHPSLWALSLGGVPITAGQQSLLAHALRTTHVSHIGCEATGACAGHACSLMLRPLTCLAAHLTVTATQKCSKSHIKKTCWALFLDRALCLGRPPGRDHLGYSHCQRSQAFNVASWRRFAPKFGHPRGFGLLGGSDGSPRQHRVARTARTATHPSPAHSTPLRNLPFKAAPVSIALDGFGEALNLSGTWAIPTPASKK